MSETGGAGGLYSVAAGIEAQVNKDAEKAVAIGYRTKTKQTGGIAVGYDTRGSDFKTCQSYRLKIPNNFKAIQLFMYYYFVN